MLDLVKIRDLASNNQSPFYIFDLDEFQGRLRDMQEILGADVQLAYAMKANPFLVHAASELPVKFEVCSPGEFAICERERIDMKRIILSGVNKEKADIEHTMDACGGVGTYTVESVQQFLLLDRCATERKMHINVLLRVTSGNQFGLDEDNIREIVEKREAYPYVHILGLQAYTGTQKKKFEIVEKEIDWLDGLCDELKEKYGFVATEFEYGPGLKVDYFGKDAYNNNFDELKKLSKKLDSIRAKYHITLEIGRYMAATCGMYVTSVADIKVNKGQNYCLVDGGINHVNYYGQTMAMKIPAYTYIHEDGTVINGDDVTASSKGKWTIVGSLCTVADVIVKNLPIGTPALGDTLIFYNVGAYSITEAIYLFLSRKMPKVLSYSSKDGVQVYRGVVDADRINSRQSTL